ncbi:hypothetical protein L227DRAFT_89414 [Lentinus tigrinus ALCF2SS1-6]|uniref:Uncharacterized protein n=1 Tax=Lentinus tigrinus ALCF2SS1-6 TaxID=1328759 RepID=A0A5C2SBP9_9APHY|nr:hypothetical protein L227DRAFT_89414 [Lentinus tigrinus ALCF2SS1-6]
MHTLLRLNASMEGEVLWNNFTNHPAVVRRWAVCNRQHKSGPFTHHPVLVQETHSRNRSSLCAAGVSSVNACPQRRFARPKIQGSLKFNYPAFPHAGSCAATGSTLRNARAASSTHSRLASVVLSGTPFISRRFTSSVSSGLPGHASYRDSPEKFSIVLTKPRALP